MKFKGHIQKGHLEKSPFQQLRVNIFLCNRKGNFFLFQIILTFFFLFNFASNSFQKQRYKWEWFSSFHSAPRLFCVNFYVMNELDKHKSGGWLGCWKVHCLKRWYLHCQSIQNQDLKTHLYFKFIDKIYEQILLTGSKTNILQRRWTASCVAWLDRV